MEGLLVTDAVVVIDHQQGERENLTTNRIRLHSLITLTQMVEVLAKHEKISEDTERGVCVFLAEKRMLGFPLASTAGSMIRVPYEERALLSKNPAGRRLFEVMAQKKSNLCVTADLSTAKQLLELADKVGSEICMLKTHVDILPDFTQDFASNLRAVNEMLTKDTMWTPCCSGTFVDTM